MRCSIATARRVGAGQATASSIPTASSALPGGAPVSRALNANVALPGALARAVNVTACARAPSSVTVFADPPSISTGPATARVTSTGPAGHVLAIGGREVDAAFLAEPGQELLDGDAAGLADQVADHQDPQGAGRSWRVAVRRVAGARSADGVGGVGQTHRATIPD